MSENVQVGSFYKYLISQGYYFDKELIENFLLSLKVKPFEILTGNSGTGKTKLSQLFAQFLCYDDYHKTKVTTRARSWGYKPSEGTEGHECGWSLIYEYAKDFLPLDELQGNYEIEVGGYISKADFKLTPQLYYDKENKDLKNYFKKLYDIENEIIEEDKKFNVKHRKQLVDLYINYEGINSVFSDDYTINDEIIITMNNIDSFLSGTVQLAVEFFDYIPINSKSDCIISANDIFANAYFDFKYRISNYLSDDIKTYLSELKKTGEKKFQLKIRGFPQNISKFKPNFNWEKLFDLKTGQLPNYCIVPVGANWTDNTQIIGYHNVITGEYHKTPAYKLIEEALQNPNRPYFLILDEMNLSHVERYFADFLSAIESGEKIPLYNDDKRNEFLELPDNLFIIGTVNVDETTYMFSPKVLDRANTIEFETISAEEYMINNGYQKDFNGNINYLQSPLEDSDIINYNIDDLKEILSQISCGNKNLWEVLAIEITSFQDILKLSNMDFGFRVINEILRFMVVAWKYENELENWDNWERYFDAQIKQKILPKLHGSEKAIGNILNGLFNLCLKEISNNENPKNFEVTKDNARYYTSAIKLQNMVKVLDDQRYVSFIN